LLLKHDVTFLPAKLEKIVAPDRTYWDRTMLEMRFVTKGPEGALEFRITTDWTVLAAQAGRIQMPLVTHKEDGTPVRMLSATVVYHSYVRGQGNAEPDPMAMYDHMFECDLLENQPCHFDAQINQRYALFECLVEHGETGLWAAMDELYLRYFDRVSPQSGNSAVSEGPAKEGAVPDDEPDLIAASNMLEYSLDDLSTQAHIVQLQQGKTHFVEQATKLMLATAKLMDKMMSDEAARQPR
jgi:hypothetical protein